MKTLKQIIALALIMSGQLMFAVGLGSSSIAILDNIRDRDDQTALIIGYGPGRFLDVLDAIKNDLITLKDSTEFKTLEQTDKIEIAYMLAMQAHGLYASWKTKNATLIGYTVRAGVNKHTDQIPDAYAEIVALYQQIVNSAQLQ